MQEEEYREQRKNSKRALVQKIKDDAEKKYDKYWYEYQVSGTPSKEKTALKYEDLIKVCNMALEGLDDGCYRCMLRSKNGKEIIRSLKDLLSVGETTIDINTAIDYIEVVSSF